MPEKKKLKQKKCRHCGEFFNPYSSMSVACSGPCALALARAKAEREKEKEAKKERQEIARQKKELRESDRSWWLSTVQTTFNKYIRTRDKDDGCISCGIRTGQMHAGHYRSVGAQREALRYEPDNCHKQCAQCNKWKGGNKDGYRPALVKKLGEERVLWLDQDHPPRKHTIEELRALNEHFKELTRELEEK